MARWLALTLGLVLSLGCGAGPDARPHVLLVTVDTLRPDRLSAYGYAGHRTPNIDRLAAEGVLYENAFTDTPWTTPSMVSVMTGVHGPRHGFRSTNVDRLGLDQTTLAEILRSHGYATAAIIGSFPLDSIYQLDQGFDHYDDHFTRPAWQQPGHASEQIPSRFSEDPAEQASLLLEKAQNDSRRSDAEVTDATLAWLADWSEADSAAPFFLWVHYFGPHAKPDWGAPKAAHNAQQLVQYDPDVRENDAEIGRLLAALDDAGLTDDTLVLFHADHGESLGEQGYFGHGYRLNDATMRIPFLMRFPGRVAAGLRIDAVAQNVDILPTVLAAVGIPSEMPLAGRNLLPGADASLASSARRLFATAEVEPRPIYMETYLPAHSAAAVRVLIGSDQVANVGFVRRSVRVGDWQLVRIEPHPLLDIRDEAFASYPPAALASLREQRLLDVSAIQRGDQSAIQPEKVAALAALLDEAIAHRREDAPALPVDEDIRLRLKSLGYGGD